MAISFARVKMYFCGSFITEALFYNMTNECAEKRFLEIFPSASADGVQLEITQRKIDTDSEYFKACMRCGAVY